MDGQLVEKSTTAMGMLYIAGGSMNLCPGMLPASLGRQVRQFHDDLARVSPLKLVGVVPEPSNYGRFVGVTEVALGGMLAFGSRPVQRYSCLGLMALMLYGTQSSISAGRPSMALIPLSFLGALIFIYTKALSCEPEGRKK